MTSGGPGIGASAPFITFEGGEGAGKSTQIRLLAAWLRDRGLDVVETREPGGAEGAERIRDLLVTGAAGRWTPLAETLLHYAARTDHLERSIRPALAAGRWVLCDRFADSTMAYQGYGHGVDAEFIEALHHAVVGTNRPDLTLILDLPVEVGLRRAADRRGDENRYERMAVDFHQRLRNGFLAIARRESQRCMVIDAARDIDGVQTAIRNEVTSRFGLG